MLTISTEALLISIASLLMLSLLTSRVSGRFGIPALLIFLGIGMLAGSEGPGGITFDDPHIAQLLGVVALIYILYSGGLGTEWVAIRPVLREGLVLATFGVFVTALLVGVFAHYMLGFSWKEGLLLGSIVSSTDAAAVFAILRSRGVSLKGNLRPLLELESGSNDPMAVFLTIGFIFLIQQPELSVYRLIPMFVGQMAIGSVLGYLGARLIIAVINKIDMEYDGLYPVLSFASILLLFGVIAWLGGSGFMAVYIAGIVMGNRNFIHRNSILLFHDGLAWLMQIVMFLSLGLLVFPSQLVPLAGVGALLSAVLIVLARPIGVFLCLLPFRSLEFRERLMISWVGLRGAAPIVLATFPFLGGVGRAEEIFNLVFFIVLASVLIQGTSIPFVARLLRVDAPMGQQKRVSPQLPEALTEGVRLTEFTVSELSPLVENPIVGSGLPPGVLILLVRRGGEHIVPSGATRLEAGDRIMVLADEEATDAIFALAKGETPATAEAT